LRGAAKGKYWKKSNGEKRNRGEGGGKILLIKKKGESRLTIFIKWWKRIEGEKRGEARQRK